ncbi:hypothetical protein WJX73_004010 [Symbiochloris irregularis]|uniref:Uncharacterized protein n=1 Tax=Symbiochloris irregularis TaxID=706552 RepID=A0AAW1NXH8_9CHLO
MEAVSLPAAMARSNSMAASTDAFSPPALAAPPAEPSTMTPEAQAQQARRRSAQEATYLLPYLIPASPAEPYNTDSNHATHDKVIKLIPFLAVDPKEAAEQTGRMQAAGIRVPHFYQEPHTWQLGQASAPPQQQQPVASGGFTGGLASSLGQSLQAAHAGYVSQGQQNGQLGAPSGGLQQPIGCSAFGAQLQAMMGNSNGQLSAPFTYQQSYQWLPDK